MLRFLCSQSFSYRETNGIMRIESSKDMKYYIDPSLLSNDDPLFAHPGTSKPYLECIPDECRLLRDDSAFLSCRLALPDLLDDLS